MRSPPKSLEEAIDRLRLRNEALDAHLRGKTGVSASPESSLDDATARAKKYWDKLEGKHRASVPPAKP